MRRGTETLRKINKREQKRVIKGRSKESQIVKVSIIFIVVQIKNGFYQDKKLITILRITQLNFIVTKELAEQRFTDTSNIIKSTQQRDKGTTIESRQTTWKIGESGIYPLTENGENGVCGQESFYKGRDDLDMIST